MLQHTYFNECNLYFGIVVTYCRIMPFQCIIFPKVYIQPYNYRNWLYAHVYCRYYTMM